MDITQYDFAQMARFAKIGVVPGQPFSADGLSPEIVAAMKAGIAEADQEMEAIALDLALISAAGLNNEQNEVVASAIKKCVL